MFKNQTYFYREEKNKLFLFYRQKPTLSQYKNRRSEIKECILFTFNTSVQVTAKKNKL